MASVNLTCTTCAAAKPCASCRAIARELQAAGHSVTRTARYDALRAAMLGSYGFDACILPVQSGEQPVIDSCGVLLANTRVALVVEAGALETIAVPASFTVITEADWETTPFPTDWIRAPRAADAATRGAEDESTRVEPALGIAPANLETAKVRLKTLASRAQREVARAGFPDERLDAVAVLEDEIVWAEASSSEFGIVLIVVPPKTGASSDMEAVLGRLRELAKPAVRAGDAVAAGTESLLVTLAGADHKSTSAVGQRIANRLRRSAKAKEASLARVLRRVMIGFAAYPEHGRAREVLLARATASAKPVL